MREDIVRPVRALLRKKSGELVKPALRDRSRDKPASEKRPRRRSVHFGEEVEVVKYFSKKDRPISISVPVSVEDQPEAKFELKIRTSPFHAFERQFSLVRIENIRLSKDSTAIIGTVAVANIAYSKSITAFFTWDSWETQSEAEAEYRNIRIQNRPFDGFDRFQFSITLADEPLFYNKTLSICARYRVDGKEYWDNNGKKNIDVTFIRTRIDEGFTTGKSTVTMIETLSDRYTFSAASAEPPPLPRSRASERSHSLVLDMRNLAAWAVPQLQRAKADPNSSDYKTFLQKYCYFDSQTGTDSDTSPI